MPPNSCLASSEGLTFRPFPPLPLVNFHPSAPCQCHPSPFSQPPLMHFVVVFNDESVDKQPDLAAQILLSALFSSAQRSLFFTENKGLGPPLAHVSISCSLPVCGWLFTGQHERGPLLGSCYCLLICLDKCGAPCPSSSLSPHALGVLAWPMNLRGLYLTCCLEWAMGSAPGAVELKSVKFLT